MGRGKSWTPVEDVIACKAYMGVYENAVTGSSLRKGTFEAQIAERYNDLITNHYEQGDVLLPLESRSGCSVRQRFKDIKAACMKMEANMKRIKGAMTGNVTDSDHKRVATAMYNGQVSSATEMYLYCSPDPVEPVRPFSFPEAWKFLSSTRIWTSIDEVTTKAEKRRNAQKKRAEAAAAIYNEEGIAIEESQETGAPEVQVLDAISRPVGVKKTKNMSNALRVKKEANEKLEFLGKVEQRKAIVAEKALVLAKLRERQEFFSSEGVSAQARSKYLRLTERKMLADLEKDLDEELSTFPTEAACYGEDSSSEHALIANGEEFNHPDDDDPLPTEIRTSYVSGDYISKPASRPRSMQMKDILNETSTHCGH